jgi:hypothetical protein
MYNAICVGGFLQQALFEGIDGKPIVLYMKRLDRGRELEPEQTAVWKLRKLMKYSVFNATNSLHEIKPRLQVYWKDLYCLISARPRLKAKAFVRHFPLEVSGPAGAGGSWATAAPPRFSTPIFIMLNWAFT